MARYRLTLMANHPLTPMIARVAESMNAAQAVRRNRVERYSSIPVPEARIPLRGRCESISVIVFRGGLRGSPDPWKDLRTAALRMDHQMKCGSVREFSRPEHRAKMAWSHSRRRLH